MTARKGPGAGPGKPKDNEWEDRYPGAREIEQAVGWTEWTEKGQEIVGTFMGIERFRNGWKADVDTDDGPVVFSTPSLLLGLLKRLEIGTSIAIVYTGDQAGQPAAGKAALKEFKVFILET